MSKLDSGCYDSKYMGIGYGEGISQEEDWGILSGFGEG